MGESLLRKWVWTIGQIIRQRIFQVENSSASPGEALVTSPKLLLADEPTGNLDASIGDEIGRILVNYIRKRNAVAIIATHSETLANICDRVMVLEGGRLHKL
jgi:ABC-type lipoprotein export system ATPase subunit